MVEKLLSDRIGGEVDYDLIANRLEGYSGSDIRLVCK
jgi:SpoVK/Ycf46/Vps4 family AAA+-type ATPase